MLKKAGEYQKEIREHLAGGAGAATVYPFFSHEEFGGSHVKFCARVILGAGDEIGLHSHEGEDEVYIFLKGKGTVTDNGVAKAVQAGDSMLTGRGGSHSVHNDGPENLELLAVIITY